MDNALAKGLNPIAKGDGSCGFALDGFEASRVRGFLRFEGSRVRGFEGLRVRGYAPWDLSSVSGFIQGLKVQGFRLVA